MSHGSRNFSEELFSAIQSISPSPCEHEGGCSNRASCSDQMQACFTFVAYVCDGRQRTRPVTDRPSEAMLKLLDVDLVSLGPKADKAEGFRVIMRAQTLRDAQAEGLF